MQLSTPSRLALAAALVLASPLAAQKAQKVPAIDEATATATANAALEAAPVFDGHNDVPNQLRARVAIRPRLTSHSKAAELRAISPPCDHEPPLEVWPPAAGGSGYGT